MTFVELGPKYRFLIFLCLFTVPIIPLSALFISVLGLGSGGPFLAVLVSFVLALLAVLFMK